jgi:uncharacterized protein YndB with AHSA1/START domain
MTMQMTNIDQGVQTFEFVRDEMIEAPIEIVFQAVLDELGPESQMPNGTAMAMTLEPWPGGRWFRDLGNNAGHFWGSVQVIKPPTLLELCGPMFMSYPAANHAQYRLAAEAGGTRLKFVHKSFGLIPEDHMKGMDMGWNYKIGRIRELADRRRETSRKESR